MYKIKSVEITGMHNVDHKKYDLSDFTYFYGNNGSGKSTVLQAIQLALLGYIPGSKKTNEGIFAHCNCNAMSVKLTVESNTDSFSISRAYSKTKSGSISKVEALPENINMDDILGQVQVPIFNFNDFINLTPNKLKEWFINYIPSDSSRDAEYRKEIEQYIHEAIENDSNRNHIVSMLHNCMTSSDIISDISKLNKEIKNELSFQKSNLTRMQNSLQQMSLTDNKPCRESSVINEEIQVLVEKIHQFDVTMRNRSEQEHAKNKLNAYLELLNLDSVDALMPLKDNIKHTLNQLTIELQSTTKSANELEAITKETESKIKTAHATLEEYRKILSNPETVCPYTHETCSSNSIRQVIETKFDELQEITSEKETKYNHCVSQQKKYKYCIDSLSDEIANLNKKLDIVIECIQYYEQNKELLSQNFEYSGDENIYDINKKLDELNAELQDSYKQEARAAIDEDILKQSVDLMNYIEELKRIEKYTGPNGISSEIAEIPFNKLSDDLHFELSNICDKFDNYTPVFDLDAKSFRIGVEDENNFISYTTLSSGEKAVYSIALCTTLLKYSKASLNVLIMDDVLDHIDEQNMLSLSKYIDSQSNMIQFIFAGVNEIKENSLCNIQPIQLCK